MATLRHDILPRRLVDRFSGWGNASRSAAWHELIWIPAAAAVGYASSAVLAGWLELSRPWLVLWYGAAVTVLTVAYVRQSRIDIPRILARRWQWGALGALAFGAFMVMNVQGQDGSARPEGARLVWDVLWLGVVYGLVDALLLSVLPVLATWRALTQFGWTARWAGKVGTGALAVAASLLVTAAYHLGYPEFQNAELREPLVGNGLMSLAYVLTNNPIAALGSHIAMHIAAVLHGAEGAAQLPPHY